MNARDARVAGALLCLAAGLAGAAEGQWCTVTMPEQVQAGRAVEVKVVVTDESLRGLLNCDLHWNRRDGSYGGFMTWGGEPRKVTGRGEHVFRLQVQPKEQLGKVHALVFFSKTGKYEDHLKEAGATATVDAAAAGRVPTYKKSWIWLDRAAIQKVLVEGETWRVPIEYHLDPCDNDGDTRLMVMAVGPWIDCPDGKYTKTRQHVGYPGTSSRLPAKAGTHREIVEYTVPKPQQRNELQLIAHFQGAGGESWPWQVRGGSVWFHRKGGYFDLLTDRPGNLFTYDEPVRIRIQAGPQAAGKANTVRYRVMDYTGALAAEGEAKLPAEAGAAATVELKLARKGTFLFQAEADGWEKRHTTFCRIPDVQAVTGGGATDFGMTNVVEPGPPERVEATCRIARRIGLTWCRTFFDWKHYEPAPGQRKLECWDEPFAIAERCGVRPWLCIVNPPAWAMTDKAADVGYSAFAGDVDAFAAFVTAVSQRYKGRLHGWEWLNEITPGGTDAPVDEYLNLVRAGTKAAKAVDANLTTMLAGGLWPRSFRLAVLKAGAGKEVDVLPVHYANGPGVAEAADDLRAVGCGNAQVWDDETARGLSTWDAPPTFDLADTLQPSWVLTNWPDELAAGCRKIIYFGGQADPAGNWSYLYDDLSPRPVAATLAVLVSRLHGAKPLGAFDLGKGGLLHLFERDGKAILLAGSSAKADRIDLPVGAERVEVVDYQGSGQELACPGGTAPLALGPLAVWIDGANLDVLKAQLVAQVVTAAAGLTCLRGHAQTLTLRVRNLYDHPLAGTASLKLPAGWTAAGPLKFDAAPRQDKLLPIELTVPADVAPGDRQLTVTFRFQDAKLPEVTRPITAAVIDAASLGNLLPNGDFELPPEPGKPQGWSGSDAVRRVPAEGLGDGLGKYALRFDDTKGQWAHFGRSVELPGGRTYLYTAWVWNHDMHAGSNLTEHMADGTERSLYDVQVFTAGQESPHWQLYTARVEAPPQMVRASFTPVARGSGWALYDNLRVTVYEGSDYAAEAHRCAKPLKIDGRLDDWEAAGLTGCPLPMIGKNQLVVLARPYAWTPKNLSGVAYLAWDESNLYLAGRIRDDVHRPRTGAEAMQGDALVIGIDPTHRGLLADGKAVQYVLTSAAPGGGSGRHTLWRPQEHAAGGAWGQLAKDSSVYDLAVRSDPDGTCTYELRIPLSQVGQVRGAVGAKLGVSLMAIDADGEAPSAAMTWGDGLHPAWAPNRFGVVTMVE